ncbi:hypothetical protein [Algivirga pacifica]|uniref:Uncharacterized protein n=1 Tax=Algivirga pacifica TaxID=1162670 RepID=A0ABP9DMA4_9BACT
MDSLTNPKKHQKPKREDFSIHKGLRISESQQDKIIRIANEIGARGDSAVIRFLISNYELKNQNY